MAERRLPNSRSGRNVGPARTPELESGRTASFDFSTPPPIPEPPALDPDDPGPEADEPSVARPGGAGPLTPPDTTRSPAAAGTAASPAAGTPKAKAERDIYTVSRLNREARFLLERGLPSLWLEGEISNLSRPNSGHWYFTLKDRNAQIKAAMFRARN